MLEIQESVTVEELNEMLDFFIRETEFKIKRGSAFWENVDFENRHLFILNELKTNLSEYARI
jgi:hypothetical protein